MRFLVLIGLIYFNFQFIVAQNQSIPIVLELFTSQGCSSCPAADEVFRKVEDKYGDSLIQLAYHVDYWDRLGWKDVFGSSDYSARQREYGKFLKLNTIYTPQIIINGRQEFVGSHEQKVFNAISTADKKNSGINISIQYVHHSDNAIQNATVFLNGNLDASITRIFIVEDELKTKILRGENAGKELKYSNVVRLMQSSESKNKAEFKFQIPEDLIPENTRLVVMVQSKENFDILGVASIPLLGH